jgi:hypothetical protein
LFLENWQTDPDIHVANSYEQVIRAVTNSSKPPSPR